MPLNGAPFHTPASKYNVLWRQLFSRCGRAGPVAESVLDAALLALCRDHEPTAARVKARLVVQGRLAPGGIAGRWEVRSPYGDNVKQVV